MVLLWGWLGHQHSDFPSLGPEEKSLRGFLLEPAYEKPGRALAKPGLSQRRTMLITAAND